MRGACVGKQTRNPDGALPTLPTITSSDQSLKRETGINLSTRDQYHPNPLALRAHSPRGVASYEDRKWRSERTERTLHSTRHKSATVRVTHPSPGPSINYGKSDTRKLFVIGPSDPQRCSHCLRAQERGW